MHVWLLEPYYTGSHAAWADGYVRYSRHAIRLFQLPGMFWKWRGGDPGEDDPRR